MEPRGGPLVLVSTQAGEACRSLSCCGEASLAAVRSSFSWPAADGLDSGRSAIARPLYLREDSCRRRVCPVSACCSACCHSGIRVFTSTSPSIICSKMFCVGASEIRALRQPQDSVQPVSPYHHQSRFQISRVAHATHLLVGIWGSWCAKLETAAGLSRRRLREGGHKWNQQLE